MEYILQTNVKLREGARLGRRNLFLGIPDCVRYRPTWRENHRACRTVKTVDGLRRGSLADSRDWTLFREEDVRWGRAYTHSLGPEKLSGGNLAPLPACVSDFSRVLGSSFALPLCMSFLAFASWSSKDTNLRTWYPETVTAE